MDGNEYLGALGSGFAAVRVCGTSWSESCFWIRVRGDTEGSDQDTNPNARHRAR